MTRCGCWNDFFTYVCLEYCLDAPFMEGEEAENIQEQLASEFFGVCDEESRDICEACGHEVQGKHSLVCPVQGAILLTEKGEEQK